MDIIASPLDVLQVSPEEKNKIQNASFIVKMIRNQYRGPRKLNAEEFNTYLEYLTGLRASTDPNNRPFSNILDTIFFHTLASLLKYSIIINHLYCWFTTKNTAKASGTIMEFCHPKYSLDGHDPILYDQCVDWDNVVRIIWNIFPIINGDYPLIPTIYGNSYQCDLIITAEVLRQFPMNGWLIRQFLKYNIRDSDRKTSEKTKHTQYMNCITLWTPRDTAPTPEDIQIIKKSAKEVMDHICELFNNNDGCFNIFLKYFRRNLYRLVNSKDSQDSSQLIDRLENTTVFPFIHSLLSYKAKTVASQLIPYDLDQLYGADILNDDKYNITMVADVVYKFPLSLLCYHPEYFEIIAIIVVAKSNKDQKDGKNYVNLDPPAIELDRLFSRSDIVPLPYTNEVIERYFNYISSRDLSKEGQKMKLKDVNNQTCEEKLKTYMSIAEGFQLELLELQKKYNECIANVEQYKDVELKMEQFRQQILDLSNSLRICEDEKKTLLSDKAKEIEDLQGQLDKTRKEWTLWAATREAEFSESIKSLSQTHMDEIATINELRKKEYDELKKKVEAEELQLNQQLSKQGLRVADLEAQLTAKETEKAAIEANRLVISQKVATLEAQLKANETKHAISLNDRDDTIGKLVNKIEDYDKAATAYVQQQAEKLKAATKQKEDISKQLKAERSKLEAKDGELQESKTQAAQLGRELSAVKLQYTTQTEELDSKMKEKEQVERQLRETEKSKNIIIKEAETMKSSISALQTEVRTQTQAKEKLETDLSAANTAILTTNTHIVELEGRLRTVNGVNDVLTAQKAKLNQDLEKEQKKVSDITSQLTNVTESLGLTTKQLTDKAQELTDMAQELAAKDAQVTQLNGEVADVSRITEDLLQQKSLLEKDVMKKDKTISELSMTVEKTNGELDVAQKQKVAIASELSQREEQLRKSNQDVEALQQSKSTLEKNLDAITQKNNDLLSQRDQLKDTVEQTNKKLEEMQQSIDAQRLLEEQYHQAVESKQRELDEQLRAKTVESEADRQRYAADILSNTQQRDVLLQQLNGIKEKARVAAEDLERQQGEYATLLRQVSQSNEKANELTRTLGAKENELTDITAELTAQQSKLQGKSEEVEALKTQLGEQTQAASALEQNANALQQKIKDLNTEKEAVEKEKAKQDGDIAHLRQELVDGNLHIETLTSDLTEQQTSVRRLNEQLGQIDQKNQDLALQRTVDDEQIRVLQSQIGAANAQKMELEKQLRSNATDQTGLLEKIRKELEDSNKNAEEFQRELETAVKDKEAAEREKEENTRQLMEANETLNQQVEKGIKQNEALGKKLAEKSQEVAGLEDLKKQTETQTKELKEQLNTTKTSLDDAEKNIKAKQTSLDKLNAELTKVELINATKGKQVTHEVTELQNSVQAAEKEIRALKGVAELEQVRKKQLEDSALVNQGEIIKLTQQLELAQTSNAILTQQQELAQKNVIGLNAQVGEAQKQLLQLREEANKNQSKLQEQLNIAKKNSSELESQIKLSKHELQQVQNSKQALSEQMAEMKRAMQVTNSTGEGGHEKEQEQEQELLKQYKELKKKYTEEEKKTERLNQVVKSQQDAFESVIKEKEKLQTGITKERDIVEKMQKKLMSVEKEKKEQQDELTKRERGEVPSAQQSGKTLERAKVDTSSAFRYQPTNIKSLTHDDSMSAFDRFIEGVPINPISNTRTQQQQQQQFIYTSVVTAAKETNKLLSKPISSNRNVGYIPDFF